ncbi:hypothetical protein [Mucilaginibacter sp. FT3.2]|uniref:hypothetical protein n=1 Tax=Mucilaginibacter sp. FT3.2 TaxID=2723090 RepID=UPI00161C52F8|nr:hypothetical protein [Mucilaginibacter sp. FT3.2]MBB6232547.1 hypothetical protein [Mucilaginibacter sp. FT3.2]
MSYRFQLTPDIILLKTCGYLSDSHLKAVTLELKTQEFLIVEIEAVSTEEHRLRIEKEFDLLIGKYELVNYRDTLLYVCLLEGNYADGRYQTVYRTYTRRLRDKQLAQLLQLYNPANKWIFRGS